MLAYLVSDFRSNNIDVFAINDEVLDVLFSSAEKHFHCVQRVGFKEEVQQVQLEGLFFGEDSHLFVHNMLIITVHGLDVVEVENMGCDFPFSLPSISG